jgi:putative transposase
MKEVKRVPLRRPAPHRRGLAQPYSSTTRDAPPVAVFTGGLLRTLPGMFIGHGGIVAFPVTPFQCQPTCFVTMALDTRTSLPRVVINAVLLSGQPALAISSSKLWSRSAGVINFVVVGYVVMPEHVHLLFTEPKRGNPSLVLAALKQTFAHRLLRELRAKTVAQTGALWSTPVAVGHVWQRRFYDFIVFTDKKRVEKLRYMHRNPVQRGLVLRPEGWLWSSFRHYAYGESGPVLVNETQEAELHIRKIS